MAENVFPHTLHTCIMAESMDFDNCLGRRQLAAIYCASRVLSSPSIVTVSRPAGDALKVTGYYRGVTPPISEAHKDDAAPARFSPDGSALYGDNVRCAPL